MPVRRRWCSSLTAVAIFLGAAAGELRALIFIATADPTHNTTAPAGLLAGSGWQWQGQWGGFTGTPISSNLFLTAKHVGGGAGDRFEFAGASYCAVAGYPDPESDLIVWKVGGAFPASAPLVRPNSTLVGLAAVIFGRGRPRGSEVTVTNQNQPTLRGWRWGAADGRLRWGINAIAAVDSGRLLSTFDAAGGPEEAMLAVGDSGGGMFVWQDNSWRLAGVHLAVDGPFRFGRKGEPFAAALFDKRGVQEQSVDDTWATVTGSVPRPAVFSSTSVATRRGWIDGVIATRSALVVPVVEGAPSVAGPFRAVAGVTWSGAATILRVPMAGGLRFHRLNFSLPVRLTSARVIGGQLEITWTPQ